MGPLSLTTREYPISDNHRSRLRKSDVYGSFAGLCVTIVEGLRRRDRSLYSMALMEKSAGSVYSFGDRRGRDLIAPNTPASLRVPNPAARNQTLAAISRQPYRLTFLTALN